MNLDQNSTILSIETSCDETAAAVTRETEVLSNEIYSQLDLHKLYGGVVPDIARTAHQQKLPEIVNGALQKAGKSRGDIDAVAVTYGPGLAIALEVGVKAAKDLAKELDVPLIAVNHMQGHLASVLSGVKLSSIQFPVLGVLVSGGHTELILVNGLNDYQKIGQTTDDACGEAFDKVSNMLGLGYPGGPAISRAASIARQRLSFRLEKHQKSLYLRGYMGKVERGQHLYELPIPMATQDNLNMSYSGLKTAVKHIVNKLGGTSHKITLQQTVDLPPLEVNQIEELAAMFEEAAVAVIVNKIGLATKQYPELKEIWLGGGVVANSRLREEVSSLAKNVNIRIRLPENAGLMTDNAAMIGLAAAVKIAQQPKTTEFGFYLPGQLHLLDRAPSLSL